MDLESIKSSLNKLKDDDFESTLQSLPQRFFEPFIMHGIKLQLVQPGRLICSLIVPTRLVNKDGNSMHGGAISTLVDWVGASLVYTLGAETSGVSVEINVSYFDSAYLGVKNLLNERVECHESSYFDEARGTIFLEEIEIEAKALQVGKVIAVATVELRKKKTWKLIAHGRHTMYMAVASKM